MPRRAPLCMRARPPSSSAGSTEKHTLCTLLYALPTFCGGRHRATHPPLQSPSPPPPKILRFGLRAAEAGPPRKRQTPPRAQTSCNLHSQPGGGAPPQGDGGGGGSMSVWSSTPHGGGVRGSTRVVAVSERTAHTCAVNTPRVLWCLLGRCGAGGAAASVGCRVWTTEAIAMRRVCIGRPVQPVAVSGGSLWCGGATASASWVRATQSAATGCSVYKQPVQPVEVPDVSLWCVGGGDGVRRQGLGDRGKRNTPRVLGCLLGGCGAGGRQRRLFRALATVSILTRRSVYWQPAQP